MTVGTVSSGLPGCGLFFPHFSFPASHIWPAAQKTPLQLGHRVVNVRSNGPVPFGLSGTVVGIFKEEAEVLFDECFLAASNLQGR